MMKEGPTLVVIPEQRVWNCFSINKGDNKLIEVSSILMENDSLIICRK